MDTNRKTALDVLTAYERDGAYPNLELKKRLRGIESDRDRRFISALVYGVIEKKLTLDYYIGKVSSVKLRKINAVVLTVLRMGLYQIMFLSTPESAACSSSVELAKTNGQIKSAGFVNAVLRKLSKSYNDIPLPENRTEYLSVRYSVSPSVLSLLVNSLGEQNAKRYLEYDAAEEKAIYIAANPVKLHNDKLPAILQEEGITALKTDFEGLYRVQSGFDIEGTDAYRRGFFHVIGKASYIAAKAVGAKGSDIVYDMCAAPGGKTFAVSYMSNGQAEITAFDLHKHKTDIIKKDIGRLGLSNIKAVTFDSTKINEKMISTADCVLCDVPCSGLGILHNKPDIKYKNTDELSLINVQKQILKNGALYLKPGGRLVYSTCTVNNNENSEVVYEFLANNPQFEIDKTVDLYNNEYGQKLFLPYTDGTDGFYIAVMKKKEV
ncbi:MAG: 16S rRNA (cytosine(967)-C(5))-methyltransferase RsmB [Clostridia bacterium]|nr:16S rRNA (cytosine(967)-C(5))-methyltransferase RsmB [Clostridia bacterium]